MSRNRRNAQHPEPRGNRNRFGQLRDPKTRAPIIKRPKGGFPVYEHQPCRRCGVSIRRGGGSFFNDRCACQTVKAQPASPMQKRRKGAHPPMPGAIFAAFTNGRES